MPDGYEVLSKVSGLPQSDIRDIWQQVKANHAKLEACTRHYFERIEPEKPLSKYRCTSCGGEVSAIDASWYNKGLEHASA